MCNCLRSTWSAYAVAFTNVIVAATLIAVSFTPPSVAEPLEAVMSAAACFTWNGEPSDRPRAGSEAARRVEKPLTRSERFT